MPHDFIPRRDAEFLVWSANFRTRINDSPLSLGISVAQAEQYSLLHEAYAAAYRLASDPGTSTRGHVAGKNTARRNLERFARFMARIIQGSPTVTDEEKINLGVTVRTAHHALVPRPTEPPRLFVKLLHGSTVRITLLGKDTNRHGKPEGVAGAMVYSFVGDTPPDSLSQWKSEGGTTKPRMNLTLSGEHIRPGARVWFTACWYNPRAQRGPACLPKSTYIQCPTMMLGNASLRSPRLAA